MNIRFKLSLIVSVIAVIGLLGLQYVWTYKLYLSERSRIQSVAYTELELSLQEALLLKDIEWQNECFQKYGRVPSGIYSYRFKDTTVCFIEDGIPKFKHKCKSIKEFAYYISTDMGRYHLHGLNINQLDSIFTSRLAISGVNLPYVVEIVDCETGKPTEASADVGTAENYMLATDSLPLGIDGKAALVARFDGSFGAMFRQTKGFMVFTIEVVVILILILGFLVRTILYQKKIADQIKTMSHEIRSPLAFFQRMLDSLPETIQQGKYATVARFRLTLMNLMLDKLLAHNKTKIDMHPEEFNIKEVFENIATQYELMLGSNAAVQLKYETKMDVIKADKLGYINAVVNLVDNAVKYARENPQVLIRCYEEDDRFCVSVSDKGAGIPRKYLKKIFRRGFRVPAKKSVARSGFGIGLSYIRMVARGHKGNITVKSVYKQGSTFLLTIPIKKSKS